MLRIIHFRPFLLNTCIRTPRQLAVLCRPLSVETLSAHRDIDDCNHRVEIAAPHHELLEVLHYRSSQLQSFTKTIRSPRKMSPSSDRSTAKTSTRPRSNANRKTLIKSNIESKPVKEEKPIDLARPKASKSKEKKKKEKKPTPSPVSTPTNRINELSKKLKLTKSTGKHQSKTLTNNNNNNNNISDEILAAENEHEGPQSEEPLILPVIDEATANDEDKTLNELLTSLNSTKVRRLHKYTDLQIKFMHTHNEFNRMLQAYVDVLVSHGKLNQARRVLDEILSEQERRRSSKILAWRYVTNVHVFNSLYFGYAEKGNLPALQKLFETMRKFNIKPTLESYAAAISCLGSMELLDSSVARRIILDLEKEGFRVLDIFNLDCLNHEHIQSILKVLKTFRPDFDIPLRSSNVNSKILNSIYEKSAISKDELIQTDQWWKDTDLKKKLDEQIQMEKAHRVKIKSINAIKLPDEKLAKRYENFLVDLEQQLTVGFLTELEILKQKVRKTSDINIIPFLEIFEPKEYIDLMLKTLHQHSYASEFHSSPFVTLCVTLGKHLYQKYVCKMRQKNGFIDKLHLIYDDYTNHVVTNQRFIVNERQKWNEITKEKFAFMDRNDRRWTFTQVLQVGEFLYDVMLKHAKIRVPLLTNQYTASNKSDNSIMHIVYRNLGACSEKQVKIHPTVLHFFSHIPEATLDFSCTELPCLVPPLPWLSSTMGGYLLTQTEFVRSPFGATQQDTRLRTLPTEKIGGLFDSINILNSCPWKINGQVLDLLMDIFRRGGDRRLSVPVSIENANLTEPLPIEKGLSTDELKRREIALAKMRKLKAEIFSLWCYELYRLSIANHFRNEIFWFPHNLDFRGRVYPIPPHFNHLGSDIARSIILFAEGKPLGPNGLRQLKIHLVNLTDLKKKASINDRAKYADEIMDDILDSADRPLEGRQWWKQSEEPWQTLACCMEIACAIRSPDHKKYVSHFPVHQDGSCNVLQHYAAMGLDDIGAASVNLKPNDLPQDVYSVVVDQVEQERKQDAANGLPIAKILEGFIKRKVIKQTIMTTNYGVTLFGARQQISRQLRDIDEFPREHISEASSYLAQKTFISLRELFRETRKIQDWFTDCARLISRVREAAVEWNTPLNLPVVQPYYQEVRMRHKGKDIYDYYSSFARPNSTKQKNAFPPNYVHSLDSTHMMMTALQCARNGITFVSVHDSFWTHACDADRLSKYCREQFVALHKEPLLEILSQELVSKYEFKSSEYARADEKQKQTMKLLNETLRRVPERGTFKLESVLDSTYFFS